MAVTARWCDRRAQASISSRVTPALTAAFQPTVMDMSMLGASGLSRWLGDIQSDQSSVPGTRRVDRGEVDCEYAPPAITARSIPARTDAAALWTAASEEAQCRLWATPGTWTRPASMAEYRAMSPPP